MTSPEKLEPRKTPCASCPYRRNVPSGIWDSTEYEKLPEYDQEMTEQPPNIFMCHQADGKVCSGWLGYHDPYDMLAVRLGLAFDRLAESCRDYTTSVPLFASGAEAAEHGMRDMDAPGPKAAQAIQKLERKREL